MIQDTVVRVSDVAQRPIVTYKCLLLFLYDFNIFIYTYSYNVVSGKQLLLKKNTNIPNIVYHNALLIKKKNMYKYQYSLFYFLKREGRN